MQPLVAYCAPIWHPRHKRVLKLVQTAQNRFSRLFCGQRSTGDFRLAAGIHNVENQLRLEDIRQFSRDLQSGRVVRPAPPRETRSAGGSNFPLEKTHTETREHFYHNRARREWNSLPDEIKKIQSHRRLMKAASAFLLRQESQSRGS